VSRRRSTRGSRTDLGLLDPFSILDGLASSMSPRRLRGEDILELLGEDEEERVENVTAMLRRSSEEDVNELIRVVQQAMARVAQERASR
jgi:hypothetical protein